MGLKLDDLPRLMGHVAGFRRTLVGLKHEGSNDHSCNVEFQTDPSGVEARSSHYGRGRRRSFQTDPSGVEALIPVRKSRTSSAFQTDPSGVEAFPRPTRKRHSGYTKTSLASSGCCFRRTLVGLKREVADVVIEFSGQFQTDPSGVEAREGVWRIRSFEGFRRTLVGLKLATLFLSDCRERVSDGP